MPAFDYMSGSYSNGEHGLFGEQARDRHHELLMTCTSHENQTVTASLSDFETDHTVLCVLLNMFVILR